MILLLAFAFLAGIVTILSPCILPVLPIVLSSSADRTGKQRPLGVVTGFILSFTFFTLFLSAIVRASGIPADSLRFVSILLLAVFGISMLIPKLQIAIERMLGSIAQLAPKGKPRNGFAGGVIVGLSLGLLWTPCVGPILASVISLAITGTVTASAVAITLAYAAGTAIPMFLVMQAGSAALRKVPWLLQNTEKIQTVFGAVMVLTAVAIFFNIDRRFQSFILDTFPQYGVGLTKFEDNPLVKRELSRIAGKPNDSTMIGKPLGEAGLPKGPAAAELIPGGAWFNSKPLTLASLRGKVVVIDFWTYTCINCQRTLPYLSDWWQKYKDKGLVIIGIHAPEFEFEKNPENVRRAISDFGLTYPVMQDNDFATWRAYDNHYWPAKYFIDKDGYVRATHFGEGAYDESEKIIRELLTETGASSSEEPVNNPDYRIYARTPELYLGYWRLDSLSSPEPVVRDAASAYSLPAAIPGNSLAFSGTWAVMEQYASPKRGAGLTLTFESKEVFLVMRPKGKPATIKIFVDNRPAYFGEDVNTGIVTVDADRLYKIVHLPEPGRHTLRLEFTDDNAELYAFTFG